MNMNENSKLAMKARKKKITPALPKDALDAANMFSGDLGRYVEYFHCAATVEPQNPRKPEVALTFIPSKAKQILLNEAIEEAFTDDAFSIVPDYFYQHLTIHYKFRGYILPGVQCLMSSKYQQIYKSVFSAVKDALPDFVPTTIFTDYEAALSSAFVEVLQL